MRFAVAILAALALTSCAAEPASPTEFETKILDRAVDAFGDYVDVIDAIYQDGGAGPERLDAVATGETLSESKSALANGALRDGVHTIGDTTFDSVELQNADEYAAPGEAMAVIRVCVDMSDVDVVDANGVVLEAENRVDRTWYVVTLTPAAEGSDKLLVLDDVNLDSTLPCEGY